MIKKLTEEQEVIFDRLTDDSHGFTKDSEVEELEELFFHSPSLEIDGFYSYGRWNDRATYMVISNHEGEKIVIEAVDYAGSGPALLVRRLPSQERGK